MDLRTDLLRLVTAYTTFVGDFSEERVSRAIYGNSTLFNKLRAGEGCTIDTFQVGIQYFSDRWPAGLEWPADLWVRRPDPKRQLAA
jgi:hypothetical protein